MEPSLSPLSFLPKKTSVFGASAVCWLLAGWLSSSGLLAAATGAAPPDQQLSEAQTQISPSQDKSRASSSEQGEFERLLRALFLDPEQAPAKPALPKPAPGLPKAQPTKREDLPRAFRRDTPSSLSDLNTMQEHVKKIVARVSPAVVAVEVGGGSGSGVVISEDGLVLCAAHVGGAPDREVLFTFPDGKTGRGKTLGTNHGMDAGLMKITDKGRWPHVNMGDLDRAMVGDWVLALGHPGGFDPQRSMVVRLGRIIRFASGMLQTDCPLIGGDSGGPLFDMHGRVIGIHSRISTSTAANFHVSIRAYEDAWDRLAKGENWGGQRTTGPSWIGAWGLDHSEGFRVELVNQDGPAERAGLKVGDIIIKINGRPVKSHKSFEAYVSGLKVGEEAKLDLKREEQKLSLKVKVEPRPAWSGR